MIPTRLMEVTRGLCFDEVVSSTVTAAVTLNPKLVIPYRISHSTTSRRFVDLHAFLCSVQPCSTMHILREVYLGACIEVAV